nr:immunoglobulin heavy chain junction region [Macaca mulatta]MOW89007.1 immunoglobulin heavy chain junction region [Macaca mulatta]MOW90426.1 immunoglobulin heavy chain junction region [Macaca mulatta]MOW91876.1 immunoglobulin heavy chain junction region [Macaca mulatta]
CARRAAGIYALDSW